MCVTTRFAPECLPLHPYWTGCPNCQLKTHTEQQETLLWSEPCTRHQSCVALSSASRSMQQTMWKLWISNLSNCTDAAVHADADRSHNYKWGDQKLLSLPNTQPRAILRRLERSGHTNSEFELRLLLKGMGSNFAVSRSAVSHIRILAGMSCEQHPSYRVCVQLLTVATTFPVFHHVDTRYTRI